MALDVTNQNLVLISKLFATLGPGGGGGGVLPYMGYIGMCRCEGYGFQAVYSSIGYSKIQLNYPKMAAEVTKLGYIARVFFPSRLLVRINVFLS